MLGGTEGALQVMVFEEILWVGLMFFKFTRMQSILIFSSFAHLFLFFTFLCSFIYCGNFFLFQDSEQVYGDFFHLVSKDLAMLFKRTYQLQKVSRIIDIWTTWNAKFLSHIMQGGMFACYIFILGFQKVNSACTVYVPESSSSLSLLGMRHSIL